MRALIVTCVVTLSSSAMADVDPPGADAKARLAGTVLVWHDARFVVDPEQPARTVQLATLKGPRAANVGVASPMRVVGVRGDLVEVEPSGDHACTWSTLSIGTLDNVRLFVSRADLAPVVVKPFTATFPDGTRVAIDAGMPVMPAASGYIVPISFEAVPVEMPAAHVGYAYARAPAAQNSRPIAPGTELFHMRGAATAKLGGKAFTTRDELFTELATRVETTGDVTLFPLVDRCARAKVALAKSDVSSYREPEPGNGGPSLGMGMLSGGRGDFLPKGTPMFVGKHRIGTLHQEEAVKDGTCLQIHAYFDQPFLSGPRSSSASSPAIEACAPAKTRVVHREGIAGAFGKGFGGLEEPLRGNVLVWADAVWHADAEDRSATVRLGRRVDRSTALGHVLPAKVVGTSGDFVEVELAGASDCAWAKPVGDLAGMRLFVKRADLAPVLAKPFKATYKNGSRISLSPGVPISQASRISIRGDEVQIAVPPASIGRAYPSTNAKPVRLPPGKHRIAGAAKIGDASIELETSAATIVKRGDVALVPLRAACIDAVAAAPTSIVSPLELGGFGAGGAIGGLRGRTIQERWFIAKGTPLRAASGRIVGKTRAEIEVDQPAPDAKRVCTATKLAVTQVDHDAPRIEPSSDSERTLELCVPVEQVKHVDPMPPRP